MRTRTLLLTALLSASALAQVRVEVALPPPPEIRFEVAPPLVEVSPGIQVVPDRDEEVFVYGGHYWVRRDGRWWRSHDGPGGWEPMERRHVPAGLYRIPEGRYRRWHTERREERAERHEQRELREEERREVRDEMRGERREERAKHHEEKERGERMHGEGHEHW